MGTSPAEALMAFTASLSFDRRLAEHDLLASAAHVDGLLAAGVLSDSESKAIQGALLKVGIELTDGTVAFEAGDEDIHTVIERRVTEIAGAAGAKLHSGRSRNDQVATAMRLFTKAELNRLAQAVLDLQATIGRRAEEAGDAILPGYTHLQRAQPVLLAHHLLAHGWALSRDVDRIFGTVARLDVSPLGAGALAGSSLGVDPGEVASTLGFSGAFENSLDAVSDRDFVAEALFDIALLGVHLSRIGEEVVLFSSQEFGFFTLDDAWATGSSMLPQKKNPDVAELARAKAGRLIGHLAGFLATLKGLPLSYNRDLQEDKEPLFDSLDQALLATVAMDGLLATVTFELDHMRDAAAGASLAAVDLAEWLVRRGVPFREAHGIVGALVRDSSSRGTPLAELVAVHPAFGVEALELFEVPSALRRQVTPGGTGPFAVELQRARYAERLAADSERLADVSP